MKKIFALLLAAMMLFALLTACGGSGNTKSTDDEKESTASVTDEGKKEEKEKKEKTSFKIGETWTVDGQWELTVNSVEETQDRNEFSDKDPAAVYIVNYSYTNLGYEDEDGIMDGLYLDIEDSIVDSAGTMGYSYPGNINQYPQQTPVGATCNAQACIGVDNAGDFKINVSTYDGKSNKQTATFELSVAQ